VRFEDVLPQTTLQCWTQTAANDLTHLRPAFHEFDSRIFQGVRIYELTIRNTITCLPFQNPPASEKLSAAYSEKLRPLANAIAMLVQSVNIETSNPSQTPACPFPSFRHGLQQAESSKVCSNRCLGLGVQAGKQLIRIEASSGDETFGRVDGALGGLTLERLGLECLSNVAEAARSIGHDCRVLPKKSQ